MSAEAQGVRNLTGYRPAHQRQPILVEPGSIPRLNGLPVLPPYVYRGTGTDTLTPNIGLYVSDECWDEKCRKCADPADCLCACHDEPDGETP